MISTAWIAAGVGAVTILAACAVIGIIIGSALDRLGRHDAEPYAGDPPPLGTPLLIVHRADIDTPTGWTRLTATRSRRISDGTNLDTPVIAGGYVIWRGERRHLPFRRPDSR